MKKRILSFLLVVCTLLTMIPVMSTAAEQSEEAVASNVESTNADYAELYVQAGLVHAYMAFGTSDASYDIAGGVWYDLVGSANATLAGGAYSDSNLDGWKVGAHGGLVYEDNDAYNAAGNGIIWTVGSGEGQLNLPATYTVEYLSRSELRDVHAPWSTAKLTSAAVDGGTQYTATTVKWAANYGKLIINFKGAASTKYSISINGGSAFDVTMNANGTYAYSGSMGTASADHTIKVPAGLTVESVQYTSPVNEFGADQGFAFGSLRALVWTNALGSNSWGNGFGSVRWIAANRGWNGNGYNCAQLVSEDRVFAAHDGKTLAMTVVKKPYEVADIGMSETYTISYGSKAYGTASYTHTPNATTATVNGNSGTGLLGSAPVFQVQKGVPGAVYSLRMYDCEIDAAVKAQNHFVDIMAYTRYSIEKYNALSAETKTALYTYFADAEIEGKVTADIDAAIARIEGTASLDDTLYVQNGLVALYLTDNIDITNGVWYNSVANGANATLKGSWHENTDGSVAVNKTLYGSVLADGTLTSGNYGTKLTSNWDSTGSYLDLGIANLPDSDFTISMTAAYDNVQTRDFRTGELSGGWKNGRMIYTEQMRFMFGYFGTWNSLVGTGGDARWAYTTGGWQQCGDWGGTMGGSGQTLTLFKARLGTGYYTETITRDETVVTETQTTATYAIWQDASGKRSGTFKSDNASAPIYQTDESGGGFYLFRLWPADVISVAVYNRVLDATEMKQNHAADIVEYYGLDISSLLKEGNEKAKADFIALAANFEFSAANFDARKEGYQAAINSLGAAEKSVYDDLYVSEGLVALYTMFNTEEARDTLLSGLWGNKVEGGAAATVKGPMYGYDSAVGASWGWQLGENGGLKTSYVYDTWKKVVNGKNSNTANFTGVILDPALLDSTSSTVEFVGTLEPLLYANGTPYITNDSLDKYGAYDSLDSTFAVGIWKNVSFLAQGHSGASFGQDRWHYHSGYWGNHNGASYGGGTATFRANLAMDSIIQFAMMQTVTPAATEGGIATSSLSLNFNNKSTWNFTSDGRWYDDAKDGVFKVFNGIGGSIYAVRVYNDVLDSTKLLRNHFVDILAYYKIDTEQVSKLTDEQIAVGAATFADVQINNTSKANVQSFMDALTGKAAADSLYVKDGLVGLFTAYNKDLTVDLAAGKWFNKVDGTAITLAGAWKNTENGAITNGPFTYGRANYVDNYYGGKVALRDTSKYNTWNHNNYVNLGIDMLPEGNYSIEIVSEFYETMLLTDEGERVPYLSYAVTYWYNKTENGATTVVSSTTALANTDTVTYELIGTGYTPADGYASNSKGSAIGNVKVFTSSGGRFEGNPNYAYRWYLATADNGWGSFGYGTLGASQYWEDKGGVYSTIPGSVQTKMLTREMVYENEALTSVKFGLYRNASKVAYGTMSTDSTKGNGNYYPADAAETVFYLFKNEEVDLYSIRIYNRVLTKDEQKQNRFADVVAYYNLDLTKYNDYTDALKASALNAVANLGFTSDKATAQTLLDSIASYATDGKTAYDNAYVQSGLVGLFTSFGAYDASVDLVNGVWANKVADGENATLVGGAYLWTVNPNGGMYYTLNVNQYPTAVANKGGINLSDSYADLENFTVEAVYKTIGITDWKGEPYYSEYTAQVTDANGVTIPASGQLYGNYKSDLATHRFGLLNAFGFASRRTSNDNNSLGMFRWYVSNYHYNMHGGAAANSAIFAAIGNDNQAFYNALRSGTFTYNKATAAAGVTYTMGYNSLTGISGTVAADKYAELAAFDYADSADKAGEFSLLNGYPAEVYAIRVYNRALTEDEFLQNHFVDMAAYFGLDLSLIGEGEEATIYAAFKNISTESSATYVKALYGFYVGDKDALAASIGAHAGYAPLLGDESGYRVRFSIEKGAYDLFASGYTINYGAIVAIGEWGADTINTQANLTVSVDANGNVTTPNSNAQVVLVGGTSDGSNLYYEDLGDTMIYSVAVTAEAAEYGAGILVRGFYTLTDGKGNTKYYYMDPAEDGVFSGAVSVMEAADYYVNKYDGNVALAYQYMNCASMLKVLDACGVAARTGLGGDLTFYVEADGSDENNGLTKDTALATLEAAFAAAKAHLASDTATGVVIEIGEGEFFVAEPLTMDGNDFGDKVGSVVIRGQGDKTVVTGAVEIDASSADADASEFGEYIINLADENGKIPAFRYLYANGELMDIVSAGSEENYFDVGTVVEDATAKTAKIYMDPNYINTDYDFIGTEVHITVEWNFNIIHVVDVDVDDTDANGKVAVYVDYDQFKNMAVYSTVNNREYWLANGYGLLANASNEGANCYYYDEHTGNLHILDENFDSTTYAYAGVENAFIFSNIDGLTVEDFTITGVDNKYVTEDCGLKGGQAGSNGRTVDGTLSGGDFLTLAAIFANNITNSKFEGLTIKNVGGDGINLRGLVENVEIVSNKITHVGESAIRIGANNGTKTANAYNKDIVIANNYINGTGEFFKQCCGMLITNGANISIIGNTIVNTTYTAISIGWIWHESTNSLEAVMSGSTWNLVNVEVAYNYISDIMTCMRDGGAIYILGGNAANDVTSYFNYMHDNYLVVTEKTGLHDGQRWFMGYYHDGASSNWYDYNNVVVNATTSGVSNFVPYYVQGISGQLSHNVKLYGNYAIGFANGEALYKRADRIVASRGIQANDYIFSDKAMNSSVVGSVFGNSKSLTPPSNAKALVHSIFLTAGSDLTSVEALGGIGATGGSKGEYDLVFAGGEGALGAITGGLEAPKYAVTLVSEGEIIGTYEVAAGETFTMPEDVAEPTKARGEHSSFVFTGWKNYTEGMTIVSNITIEATFDEVIDVHKVTLVSEGETVTVLDVPYGALIGDYIPEEYKVLEKESTVDKTFKFKYWYTAEVDGTGEVADGVAVEGDTTIYALYSTSTRKYNVDLIVYNPTTGEYDTIESFTANYSQNDQYRRGDRFTVYVEGEGYEVTNQTTFEEFMALYWPEDTADITYTYNNRFTLVEGNGRFFYPATPTHADYQRWTVCVYEDCVFELTFDETYRVTINGEEDWISNVEAINFNSYVPEGYKLTGVTIGGEAIENVDAFVATADVAGKAIEIATEKITYTVNFMVDGEVYHTATVAHGDVLELPEEPTKSGFVFSAWEGYTEGMVVTSAVTLTAVFEEAPYAAGDLDGNGTVNAIDADLLYQLIAKTIEEDGICGTADLDGNGAVNAIDADLLYQIIASNS